MCLVAGNAVSGEVGRQHPAGSDIQDTELPQPSGGTKACISFPVDVEDDSDDADDDLPAGACGCKLGASVLPCCLFVS